MRKSEGFDGDFFLLRDEVDLCWRIWLHGFKVLSIPSSIVYHYGSAIIKKTYSNPMMEFFFTRNNLIMFTKNYSSTNLVKYLPLFILLRTFVTIYNALKSKNPKYIKLLFDAIVWNLINLKKTLIKRWRVQKSIRRVRDEELIGRVISPKIFLISQLKLRVK